jgi:hypothetical protein
MVWTRERTSHTAQLASSPKSLAVQMPRFAIVMVLTIEGPQIGFWHATLMNEEMVGDQVSQMHVRDELIVSAVGIEHLIMMSGLQEIVKLLH